MGTSLGKEPDLGEHGEWSGHCQGPLQRSRRIWDKKNDRRSDLLSKNDRSRRLWGIGWKGSTEGLERPMRILL